MEDFYNIERFKQAQDLGVYDKAFEEVRNGKQDTGFGSSSPR